MKTIAALLLDICKQVFKDLFKKEPSWDETEKFWHD